MLNNVVKKYLEDLQKLLEDAKNTRSSTPELSFRPLLDRLIRDSCEILRPNEISVVFEPSSTGKGRPDFRLHNTQNFGIYGYIECKAISSEDVNWSDYEKQIRKYCELGYPVVLTDGLEFISFKLNEDEKIEIVQTIKLLDAKLDYFNGHTNGTINTDAFTTFLLSIVDESPLPRNVNRKILTDLLARRARFLRDDTFQLLESNHSTETEEYKVASNMKDVFNIFQEQLDQNLTKETFSSLVGQILIFSLLSVFKAIKVQQLPPNEVLERLVTANGLNYPPLKALCSIIATDANDMGVIKVGWTDAALLLSYVNIRTEELEDYHKLYEEFHTKYDPEERIDFGAFPTPSILAKYIVKFCKEIIQNGSFGNITLFDPKVRIIDPSCGTGTLLEQLIEEAAEREIEEMTNVFGIEILPVPYTLAQMRLESVIKQHGIKTGPLVRLGNSLSDPVVNSNTTLTSVLESDPSHVKLLKKEFNDVISSTRPPLMLILGNPPVSDSGFNMGEHFQEIHSALDDFRPPIDERTGRNNIQKSLQNDFVKFIRWACLKIDPIHGGVISFVVPNSALVNRSYRYMRLFFLENFDEIYVLEFDRDKRADLAGESLFNTQQGRALLTVVKKPQDSVMSASPNAKLHYKSIADLRMRSEKVTWLTSEIHSGAFGNSYNEIQPIGDLKAFVHIDDLNEDASNLYAKLTTIDSLFHHRVSGVKTACTSLVVHSEKEGIVRVLSDYIQERVSDDVLYKRYFDGQVKTGDYVKGWKRAWMARHIIDDNGVRTGRIFNYDFRPFVRRYIYFLPKMMAENSGGRPRPELERAFCNTNGLNNIGLSIAQSPDQLGVDLDEFTTIVTSLPDNDLVRRGNAFIFPIWFAPKSSEGVIRNIKQEIFDVLPIVGINSMLECNDKEYEEIATQLIGYMYAITRSKFYRTKFNHLIYHGVLQGFARIPITSDPELFDNISKVGLDMIQAQESVSVDEDLQVSISGELPFPIAKFSIKENEGKIILEKPDRTKIEISGIPQEVLKHRVAGYDVVEEWLKYKRVAYLHRPFITEDMTQFLIMLSAIKMHLDILPELDSLVEQVIESDLLFIQPI